MKIPEVLAAWITQKFWPWFTKYVWPLIAAYVVEALEKLIDKLFKAFFDIIDGRNKKNAERAEANAQEVEDLANQVQDEELKKFYKRQAEKWREEAEQLRSELAKTKKDVEDLKKDLKSNTETIVKEASEKSSIERNSKGGLALNYPDGTTKALPNITEE